MPDPTTDHETPIDRAETPIDPATEPKPARKPKRKRKPVTGPILDYRSSLAHKWKPRDDETLSLYLQRIHQERHGITKARVARGAGIKRANYSDIVFGHHMPRPSTLKAIAKAWGLPEHYFLRFIGGPLRTAPVGVIVDSDQLLREFMGVETDEATRDWVRNALRFISQTMDRWQEYHNKLSEQERQAIQEQDKAIVERDYPTAITTDHDDEDEDDT